MKKAIIIFLSLLTLTFSLKAQKEANIWYFGNKAGLDFNSGSPVPLTNGAMFQHEGCATISNSNGNLLFYTNGQDVWNKYHQQMENGFGLMGGQTSTQSAIIVKLPENNNLYYIFTVPDEIGEDGLRYSIVDMSQDNGLGAVVEKNIFLAAPTEEKVTAVKHYNNRDVWVITHLWNSSAFYVYLVTPEGLNTDPLISEVGSFHHGPDVHGSMKVSPDGRKLAIVYRTLKTVELFDFDIETGEISNYLPFHSDIDWAYGIEFSKDASLMYVGDYYQRSRILQFDLNAGSNDDIINSGIEIGTVSNTHLGALQMGTDGKIYVAKHDNLNGDHYLGVINNPEERGLACNFVEDGLYLGGRECFWGLPTFVQSYFYSSYDQSIITENVCFGDTAFFRPAVTQYLNSVHWNFGDPDSPDNTSEDFETYHLYSSPGDFTVQLISYFSDSTVTTYRQITVYPLPYVELGNDTTLCGDSLTLEVNEGYASYLWQDGSTNNTYHVSEDGTYWVTVASQEGCENSDTINVFFLESPVVDLGPDQGFCEGDTIILEVEEGYASYLWQDGSTSNTYQVTEEGTYWISVTSDDGCENSDTINIFYDIPVVDLGPDQGLCDVDTLILNVNEGYASYLWQDSSTNNTYQVTESGTYWVRVTSQAGCENSDTVNIDFLESPVVELGPNQRFCEGDTITLEVEEGYASYLWQDGSTNNVCQVTVGGTYWVSVTNQDGCEDSDTVNIIDNTPYVFLGNDTTLIYGDSLILNAGSEGQEYTWQDGSSGQWFTVTEDGTYWVNVSNDECSASDTINVEFYGDCEVFVPNVFTPNTDGYNDEFFASYDEQVSPFTMTVFNRWGQTIFETNDINRHWDGKYKGTLVPKGVYYWVVEYYCYGAPDKQILKGSVTVIY